MLCHRGGIEELGPPVEVDGRRREMGLGSFPTITLAKARALAEKHRATIAEGRDPLAEKRRESVPTFAVAAELFVSSMEAGWKNPKHRQQWRNTLATYGAPIAAKPISDIETEDVLGVLTPIWREKPETASRVRGRMERVLDYAKARGWRDGPNPALWRGHLSAVLPARAKLGRTHHGAMPYVEVPAFLAALRSRASIARQALEFTILTAARTGEVIAARWDEFDLEGALWTIPRQRMKAGREHRVPLSPAALEIIKRRAELRVSDHVFPGAKPERPLSNMAMETVLRRMNLKEAGHTVHGFRSSFRDWAGEETSFPREVAEAALAHAIGDATERAYRRGDALAKRRDLMQAWAGYLGVEGRTGATADRRGENS